MPSGYSRVRVGDLAPDFTLPTDSGAPLTLSSLRGKRVVLFFYPKDASAGCSVEACEFAAEVPRLHRAKTLVLGVGPGTVKSKARFRAANGLPYPLLADEDAAVAQAFGVWREKLLFGHRYLGAMRTTYLIGPDGRVEQLWEDVAHAGHAAEVAAAARAAVRATATAAGSEAVQSLSTAPRSSGKPVRAAKKK